jgi:hypothetical protein
MITKEGKARWVYRCTLCEVERFAPDQLRILEAQNQHLRGNFLHLQNAIVERRSNHSWTSSRRSQTSPSRRRRPSRWSRRRTCPTTRR